MVISWPDFVLIRCTVTRPIYCREMRQLSALLIRTQQGARSGAVRRLPRGAGIALAGNGRKRNQVALSRRCRPVREGRTLFGTINTRDKFAGKRLKLAQHKRTRLKANNSLECRNCHNLESMDFTRQSKRAMDLHFSVPAKGEKTCIDCHKGIAHRLPDIAAVVPR